MKSSLDKYGKTHYKPALEILFSWKSCAVLSSKTAIAPLSVFSPLFKPFAMHCSVVMKAQEFDVTTCWIIKEHCSPQLQPKH